MSFDIKRGNRISQGRVTVVVDPYQSSQLIVQTGDRVYQWEGKAGFMDGFDGPSQLHLLPVGAGCLTRSKQPCSVAVTPIVVDCSPASLSDRPPDTLVAEPLNVNPAQREHLACRVEVSGNWERELLPDDLRFLNRRLLYSRNGMPGLILRYEQTDP